MIGFLLFFTALYALGDSQTPVRMMIVLEEADSSVAGFIDAAVSYAENEFAKGIISVEVSTVMIRREFEDESLETACASFYKGVSFVLDMTWTGCNRLRELAADSAVPYLRADTVLSPYIQAMDDLLTFKNAKDAVLIFETEKELNQTLSYLIGHSVIRVVVFDELTEMSSSNIRKMRPISSYYVIYATTSNMETIFKAAIDGGLVKRNGTWNLVFTDYNYEDFRYVAKDSKLNVSVNILTMKKEVCCRFVGESPCTCPNDFQVFPRYFKRLIGLTVNVMTEVQKSGVSVEPRVIDCRNKDDASVSDNAALQSFRSNLMTKLYGDDNFEYLADRNMITYRSEIEVKSLEQRQVVKLGTWDRRNKITVEHGREITPPRRFFRLGTAQAVPWSYVETDPETKQPRKDKDGKIVWAGYCIDLIKQLSEMMDFDYELVVPPNPRDFGNRTNGKWTGVVGDILRGEIDIAVGALTATSEREEVVDFVAPYFAQSGILITIRKPVPKTSLFRFMTVLRSEVWLSVVVALTVTGITIWLLDKYSPYSARNNKELYPYPCRDFTLKESVWFALTSFTPQGGGEVPKAISGRILVAAYWLFVVLTLATFTANLAAFLTVEIMQSSVQSLEQLAKQLRINYTVLANSHVHEYFINMKKAEDKLYSVWKDITLNVSSEQIEYRVWDYPIKEQYGHILQSITQTGLVESAEIGFKNVIDNTDAEYAFIHDSAEVKYEVMRNCNLTEVGEVFAKQEYAIAVQQGSHLRDEICKALITLRDGRYFNTLTSKYWNQSLRDSCPNTDDSEGIRLESVAGVFVTTIFGLALAMITLAVEVIYHRKRSNGSRKEKPATTETSKMPTTPTIRMKPAPVVSVIDRPVQNIRPRVSHISAYPRRFAFME